VWRGLLIRDMPHLMSAPPSAGKFEPTVTPKVRGDRGSCVSKSSRQATAVVNIKEAAG
jgi:hypothetical protein